MKLGFDTEKKRLYPLNIANYGKLPNFRFDADCKDGRRIRKSMASYSIHGCSSCGEPVYAVVSKQAVGDACPAYQGRKAMAKDPMITRWRSIPVCKRPG